MSKTEQLPFDLAPRAAHEREDFWVSDSNAAAMAWVDKFPAWPAPALIVSGPPGCGKTHLCRVWQKMTGAVELTPAQLTPVTIDRAVGTATAVLVDNVRPVIGLRAAEEALFHLYNMMKDRGGYVLLTAETPPGAWPFVLPDLKSRLMAAPAAAIGSPDDTLMAVVLTKLFSDRQIFVPQDVVQFILPRVGRSFAALRDLVDKVDHKALAEKRPVTVPLVRDLL